LLPRHRRPRIQPEDVDRAVAVRRREMPAIGRESHAEDGPAQLPRLLRLVRGRIPELDNPVLADAEERLSVGREGDVVGALVVTLRAAALAQSRAFPAPWRSGTVDSRPDEAMRLAVKGQLADRPMLVRELARRPFRPLQVDARKLAAPG